MVIYPNNIKRCKNDAKNNLALILVIEWRIIMKGYLVNDGYMGYVEGEYMLFASEEDYKEYFSEN